MTTPSTSAVGDLSTVATLGRGVQAAPALRSGFGVTLLLAMAGAAGRVVIPVLVQQAVDHGFRTTAHGTEVRTGLITVMAAIAMTVIVLAVWANRTAVYRLGRRSEDALFDLRVRLFEQIGRAHV